MSWGRGQAAVRRLSDQIGGGGNGVIPLKYIEFSISGTPSDDAVGFRHGALQADGSQLGSDTNGVHWIGSSGVMQTNNGGAGTNFFGPGATAKTWGTGHRVGFGFGYLPEGNAELLEMLGITGAPGDGYAFAFRNGVFMSGGAIRLASYVPSPVRPGAHLSVSGTSVKVTIRGASVNWTGAPIVPSDVTELSSSAVWVAENSIVLTGGATEAAYGTVPSYTSVRADASTEFSF